MKCVVTGGLGFIGSNLCDRLIELGHNVCVLDNLSTGHERRVNCNAAWINVDITSLDKECEEKILQSLNGNPDVIFHLAADSRIQPSFDNPINTAKNNVLGTMQMLDFAKQFNCKFIYASTSCLYDDPHKNPYALTKWFGEEVCRMYHQNYELSVAIARLFNVYGLRQSSEGKNATVVGIFEKQKIDEVPLTITGDGLQKRDFIHVFDVVEALLEIANKRWDSDIFDIGSGKNISILDVAKLFKPKSIEYIPRPEGEAQDTLANIVATFEKINWKPSVDLEEYIDCFIDGLPPVLYERKKKPLTFWEKWFGWL